MRITLEAINQVIGILFFVCYAYQFVYIPIALLGRKKHYPAARPHRFAVLVAARNEETVIGDLLDSLHRQDYDLSRVTVFVIAITAPTTPPRSLRKRALLFTAGRIKRW